MFQRGRLTLHGKSRSSVPAIVRVAGLSVVAALVVVGCGSSGGTGGRSSSSGHGAGRIVVRFNGGLATDSYVSFDPNGNRQGSLGIPGQLVAGFTSNLGTAAVADQGTLGSGHAQTFLSVGPTGRARKTRIWTLNDDLTTLPVWNPSGTTLAFGLIAIQNRDSTDVVGALPDGLWVVSRNGQHRRLVAAGEIDGVAWSPDGSKLAFVSFDGRHARLYVVSADGGRPTELGSRQTAGSYADEAIAWSPDGREVVIAYVVEVPGTSTVNESGVDAYPVTGDPPHAVLPGQNAVIYTGIAFSPDGAQLAVSTWDNPQSSESGPGTTIPLNAPSDRAIELQIAQADGSSLKPVASLGSAAVVVGWFTT